MTDHFVWHDPWALLPPIEPHPPSAAPHLRDSDSYPPVSGYHRSAVLNLVSLYGREKVRSSMEFLGYLPLRSVRLDQRTLAIDGLRRRLEMLGT